MSAPTLFENNPLISSTLFASLQQMDDNLSGGVYETRRRISLRGGKFREIINGEQTKVNKNDSMNVIIIDAAPISRSYYASAYDSENPAPPTCWSPDGKQPAPEVAEGDLQSRDCTTCPQNVRGSGQGETRACRYHQRIAVVIEGELDNVYQLHLAATSVFGDAVNGNTPMQAYARYLKAHNQMAIGIVTEISFDENNATPKLFFKAVRPLTEEELTKVIALRDSDETREAVSFTVATKDVIATDKPAATNVIPKAAAPKPKPKAAPPVVEVVEEEEEVIAEPKRTTKKSAPVPPVDEALSAVMADWDDD